MEAALLSALAFVSSEKKIEILLDLPYDQFILLVGQLGSLESAFWRKRFNKDFPKTSLDIADPQLWKTKYQLTYAERELKQLESKMHTDLVYDKQIKYFREQQEHIEKCIKARQETIIRQSQDKTKPLEKIKEKSQRDLREHNLERKYFSIPIDSRLILSMARSFLPASGSIEKLAKFFSNSDIAPVITTKLIVNGYLIGFRDKNSGEKETTPDLLIYVWMDTDGKFHYDSTRKYYLSMKPGITRFPLQLKEDLSEDEIRLYYNIHFELTPAEDVSSPDYDRKPTAWELDHVGSI